MMIEETAIRQPTHIREDAFFNNPANRPVLTGEKPQGTLHISTDGFVNDYLYWLFLLIAGATILFMVAQPDLWTTGLVVGGAAGVGLAVVNQRLQNRAVMRRFQKEGHILRGEIVLCTASTNTFILSESSAFHVKVAYQFTTPTGTVIEASHEQVRNDLNGKPLPMPETPVYVLYFNERDYYLL